MRKSIYLYIKKKKHGKICGLTVLNETNFDYIEPNKKSSNRPINTLATRHDFKTKMSLLTMCLTKYIRFLGY